MGSHRHHTNQLPDPVPLPPASAPAPPPASPPAPGPALPIGLTVHDLSPAHLATLTRLGVSQVRTTLYWSEWDHDDAARAEAYRARVRGQVQRAMSAGLDLLVCAHGAPGRYGDHWAARDALLADYTAWLCGRAREWPRVTWQPWNEPDVDTWTNLFLGPDDSTYYDGKQYGAHLADLAAALPAGTRLVSAGLAGRIGDGFATGMLDMLAARVDVTITALAVHCYGLPPALAVLARVAALRTLARMSGLAHPVWVTETGVSDREMRDGWGLPDAELDGRQGAEWASVAREAAARGVERVYGYCLDASDPSGYGILRADGSWRPAAEYLARTQGPAAGVAA